MELPQWEVEGKEGDWAPVWFWRRSQALANAEGPEKGKWAPRDLLGRGLISLKFQWVRRVSHPSPQKERRPGYRSFKEPIAQWPLLQPLPVPAQEASPLRREQMVDATSLAPSIKPLPTPNASQGPVTRVSSGLSDARQGTGPLLRPNYWIAAWAQKAWAGLDLRGVESQSRAEA